MALGFIPFDQDEYMSKLRKLSNHAIKGAYRQLKTRMASAVTGADGGVARLASHQRRIAVRGQKLNMIKDEFRRRRLSVPSARLRGGIVFGARRSMTPGGLGADEVNYIQPDDCDDDYRDADYYGEDDYYDDYYDDGGYNLYNHHDSSYRTPISKHLRRAARDDHKQDCARVGRNYFRDRPVRDGYEGSSGSSSDSRRCPDDSYGGDTPSIYPRPDDEY